MRALSRIPILKPLVAIAIGASLALAPAPLHAQDGDDPPAQAGRLSALSGAVSIQPAGSDDWGQAYPNLPLGPGDRVFTDRDGRAEIQLGQNYLRIGPNSDVTFVDARSDSLTFGVAQGAVHVRTLGLWEGQSLYVQTPSGSSTVNQQADFRVDVLPEENAAVFTTYNGDVYVSGAGGLGLNTEQGQALELIGSNPVYPQWLQPAYPDALDRWSAGRDQQISRAASYRFVSPEIPGAYELDAKGDWDPDTEYGSMWFPNVPPGWAPYHNGHWVNRDPWGWVWVADESWGYAPFHFGRWVSYRGRWGWVPGPRASHPVWSPALVVFAGGIQVGGGGGVSAWFPLGPGEAYHPWYRASPRYVNQVNITNIQESRSVHVQNTYVNNVTVNNVTNVTNVTYINQVNGVTAMRRDDMSSGRPAAQAAVRVDPRQMQHIQVLARPEAVPTRQAVVSPPARPVPVAVQRPILMNAQGKLAPARPNAQPVEPPVKAAPIAKPLPGRTIVAAPPGAKMPAPPARGPVQPGPPVPSPVATPPQQPHPAPTPDNRPGIRPPAQTPPPQPAPVPPARPGQPQPQPPAPAPVPNNRPGVQPLTPPAPQPAPSPDNRPGVRPPTQPAPLPTPPRQDMRPGERPVPPQQPPSRPAPPLDNRPGARPPAQPEPQPSPRPPTPLPDNRPPVRPPVQPAPQPPPRQEVRPTERPAPPPPPAPIPDNRPAARPPVQPPQQPPPRQVAPPPPPPRPNPQPEARPAPPPQSDNRSDKDKKDEKKPPQ